MHFVNIALLIGGVALATPPPSKEADNTKVNRRDASIAEKTAQDQNRNAADVEMTRLIRRELTMDNALSTYAQNVKIITQGQKVTLRGPVRSEEEKIAVEKKAQRIAGRESVMNELDVVKK